MSEFGYSLAEQSVTLFRVHEAHSYEKINRKNKEVDQLVTRMEKLETFLNYIATKTDDSHRLDLLTAEEQEMVDVLREEGLEHIFPPGQYQWKEGEIDDLTRKTKQYVEGPLPRQINTLTEQMVLEQHKLTQTLDIFRSGLNRMTNLTDRILANIAKAH